MIKSVILSMLPCILLGFSFLEEDNAQLYKTPEGIIVIPSSANISEADAQAVYQLISQEDEPVGSGVFNFGGQQYTYGDISMDDILESESVFNVDLINEDEIEDVSDITAGIFKNFIVRRSVKCKKEWKVKKCIDHYVAIEEAAVSSFEGAGAVDQLLNKYGYVTINP